MKHYTRMLLALFVFATISSEACTSEAIASGKTAAQWRSDIVVAHGELESGKLSPERADSVATEIVDAQRYLKELGDDGTYYTRNNLDGLVRLSYFNRANTEASRLRSVGWSGADMEQVSQDMLHDLSRADKNISDVGFKSGEEINDLVGKAHGFDMTRATGGRMIAVNAAHYRALVNDNSYMHRRLANGNVTKPAPKTKSAKKRTAPTKRKAAATR